MPNITFKPMEKTVSIPSGSPLLEAAKLLGVPVELPCGGKGICGKCLVKIEVGKVDFDNKGTLSQKKIDEGFVMICKTKVGDEDVTVRTFSDLKGEEGKFSEHLKDFSSVDEGLFPKEDEVEYIVSKVSINVTEPKFGDGLSDYDRLKGAVTSHLNCQHIAVPINVLKTLPTVLREQNGSVDLFYYIENGIANIVDLRDSNQGETTHYGLAIDIGTTTVALMLVDLVDTDILASKTVYNAQIQCGLDVISRINYARKAHQLEELQLKVLESINGVISEFCKAQDISKFDITNVSVAANTTMCHLLLGVVSEHIRLDPYIPAVFNFPLIKAGEIGIDVNPNTPVAIAPAVGSYVGGDITAGALCTPLVTEQEEVSLFIDIGTNGEILIGNNEFIIGCACSAGPAFEGGGIKHGMRASAGAIERIEIDKDTNKISYFTINNLPPKGVCGSGIISAIAELFRAGFVDQAGKFLITDPNLITVNGKNHAIIIVPPEQSADKTPITISEVDIDNFIRAKAAIFSACRLALINIGMDFVDVKKIYIAGGFGRFLNLADAKAIGLIPNLPEEKYAYIGNSSLMGAYMTLMSKTHRDKMNELANKITYIDLGTEVGYMDQYMAALFLPHTDLTLFK